MLHHLVGNGGEHGRLDEAGRHRIHPHALGAEFARPGLGHGDDAGLGRGVIGLAEVAVQPDHAGRAENGAAAALDHVRRDDLGAAEHRAQVHVDHGVELLVGHFHQPRIAGDARVVHQGVDFPELGDGGIDQRGKRGAVGHVERLRQHLRTAAAQLVCNGVEGGRVAVA